MGAGEAIAQRIQAASGRGSKLDEGVQQHLEQHLGADLSNVRIHTDSEADRLSRSVNAVAFTTDQDIFFSAGSYNPSSSEGKHLITHEVVHTVQQANGAVAGNDTGNGVSISDPSDRFELEAEQVAELVMPMPGAVDISPQHPQKLSPGHDFTRIQTKPLSQYSQTDVQRLVIQRDLFGDKLTEREKIDAALKSKDPSDVKDIKDINRATESEKLDLIGILANQGWVGLFDEYKIEEIWGSFGDQIPRIANKEIGLWQKCIARGADLDKLQEVKKVRDKFESDVKDKAAEYLNQNKDYVLQEMASLGVLNACVDGQQTPTKEEQDAHLKEIQEVAATVARAQEQVKQLRQIQVGYTLEDVPDPEIPSVHIVPLYFDPDNPPGEQDGLTDEDIKNNKGKSWKEVHEQWKAPAGVITKAANLYPSIYAAIQESQPGIFSNPDDQVAKIADEKNPEVARKAIADVLNATKTKIDESIQELPNGKPAYYKLDPIHRQFLAGLPSKSGTDWKGNEFNKWVANKDLEKHKERDYWIDIGLKTAAAAAFIAIEIATAGSATFFIAAGIGLAATGANAAIDWSNYVELARASKTNVKDDTALVDRKQVIEAEAKALESTAEFIAMCAAVGVKGVSGLKRKAPQIEPDACFVPGTKILTPSGEKSIENLIRGEVVISCDPVTGKRSNNSVSQIFSRQVSNVLDIYLDNIIITCTSEHPFWVPGNGWLKAKELQLNTPLLTVSGAIIRITTIRQRQGSFTVFNLEVEGLHTYYVTSLGILVHNKAMRSMKYKPGPNDEDWRGTRKTAQEAIDHAIQNTGVPRGEFEVTKWGKNELGKSFPAEMRVNSGPNKGAEVNIDLAHTGAAPDVPHVGWQTPGKRGAGGAKRGHIFLDDVPYNR